MGLRICQASFAVIVIAAFPFAAGNLQAQESRVTIVRGYEGMARYAAAADGASPEKREALYRRYVYEPYFPVCSNAGENWDFSEGFLRTPVVDVAALAEAVDELERVDIAQRIHEAADGAMELLPIEELTVCIFAYPPDGGMAEFIEQVMGGVFGFSEVGGRLWLQLLPVDGWLDELGPGFAHEYYHAANHPDDPDSPGSTTLLDGLVNEGGADSLAAILYPEFVPAWTRALTREQQAEVWPQMKLALDSTDQEVIRKFLLGNVDGVPFQAGYTVGFEIVQSYLAAHPDQPPRVWSRVDPKEILAKSGYDPAAEKSPGK